MVRIILYRIIGFFEDNFRITGCLWEFSEVLEGIIVKILSILGSGLFLM